MTPAAALAEWKAEFDTLSLHADLPVALWTWHDYGAAVWPDGDKAVALHHGHVHRLRRLCGEQGNGVRHGRRPRQPRRDVQKAAFDYTYTPDSAGGVLTASVSAADVGKFALDVGTGSHIASVANWYAYDDNSVFLPTAGGSFAIHLLAPGGVADNVTHISALPMRAELVTASGDGQNLSFSIVGEGQLTVDLAALNGKQPIVTGATVVSLTGENLVLSLSGLGQHDVSVSLAQTHVVTSAPASETLVAAAGTDQFVFNPGFGKDTITGFTPGTGASHDVIDFATSIFADFASVQAAAADVNGSVVISHIGAGGTVDESITLSGVLKSALVAADFMFHSG